MSAKIKNNCKNCGKIFYRYRVRMGRFCCRPCWDRYESKTGKTGVICAVCEKKWLKNKSRVARAVKNYCSMSCRNIGKSLFGCGENSNNWKGGRTSALLILRHSKEYQGWRKRIFERDNYTCRFCGKRGGQIQVDHIKPFSLYPEFRFFDGNGRTLCIECHKKTNTYLHKAVGMRRNPYYTP